MLGAALCLVVELFSIRGAWGLNLVTSIDPANSTKNLVLDVNKFAFLHVPKTGTGFINTLLTIGCPNITNEEHNTLQISGPGYIKNWMKELGHKCVPGFNFCYGGFTSHIAITEKTGCNGWKEHAGQFVGLFRTPEQRIISAFHNGRHSYYGNRYWNLTLEEYARGSAGCAVKMMAGNDMITKLGLMSACWWSEDKNYMPPDSMVQKAVQRLREGFIFVGLTEEWDLSVCLFHKMFGGSCHEREFKAERRGLARRQSMEEWDTTKLNGFTDSYDAKLYEIAKGIFWSNIQKYNVNASSCSKICAHYPDKNDENVNASKHKINPEKSSVSMDLIDMV